MSEYAKATDALLDAVVKEDAAIRAWSHAVAMDDRDAAFVANMRLFLARAGLLAAKDRYLAAREALLS